MYSASWMNMAAMGGALGAVRNGRCSLVHPRAECKHWCKLLQWLVRGSKSVCNESFYVHKDRTEAAEVLVVVLYIRIGQRQQKCL